MTIRTRPHEDSVLEMLRNDEAFALEYLSVALEEIDEAGGEDAFLVAIRRVAEACRRTQDSIEQTSTGPSASAVILSSPLCLKSSRR